MKNANMHYNKYGSSNHEIVEAFLDESVPQIRKSKLSITRILWIMIYCLGIAIFAYQMTPLFKKYISHQTQTSVVLTTAKSLNFPAVTVCNPIFLKKSRIENVKKYAQLGSIDEIREFELMRAVQPQDVCSFKEYNMVKCGESHECVPDFLFCDGINDCQNKFDESADNCGTDSETSNLCGYNSFSCKNVDFIECVDKDQICDGKEDCYNGNDENATLWDIEACKSFPFFRDSTCHDTYNIQIESGKYLKKLKIPIGDTMTYSNNLNCEWTFLVGNQPIKHMQIDFFNVSFALQSWLLIVDLDEFVRFTITANSPKNLSYSFENITDFRIVFSSGSFGVSYGANFTVTATGDNRRKRSIIDPFWDYNGEFHQSSFIKNKNLKVGDWRSALNLVKLPDNSDFKQIAMFSRADLINYGVQKDDFIVECSYDGFPCSYDDFVFSPSKVSGSCFTFNSAGNDESGFSRVRRTVRTGNEYGLKLTLFLEKEETIGILHQKESAVLSISESHRPFTETTSIDVMPGFVTRIGLRQQVITRAKHPYSDCRSVYPNFEILPNNFMKKLYVYETCLDLCVQNRLWKVCKCVDTYHFNDSYPLCNLWNDTDNECRIQQYKLYTKGELNCRDICTPACNNTVYDIKVSYSPWPSNAYVPHLLYSLLTHVGDYSALYKTMSSLRHLVETNYTFQADQITENIRDNLARVEVYYEMLNYQHFSEDPDYQLFDLVADFGGNLGLWIGWSALILMDIVEMVIEFIWFRMLRPPRNQYKQKPANFETSL